MQGIRRKQRSSRRWADGLCAALWMAALAVVAVGAVLAIGQVVGHRQPAPRLREVVLSRGGTVWGLAVRYRAEGQDPRALAAEIRRLNGIRPGRTIHPGTRLVVPDYACGATELAQNSQEPG